MARKLSAVKLDLMDHLMDFQRENVELGETKQNERLELLMRRYQEGRVDLLGLYLLGVSVAGSRAESYLQARIPFQEREALFTKMTKVERSKKRLSLCRKAFIADAA